VETINPRAAPVEPLAPEKLRALFSALHTQYSLFNSRYHLSGQIEEGNGEGDDDFFENFVRGDILYMYMHLLFKGAPPRFCIRDLDANQKSDVGVVGEGDGDSQMSGVTASGAKRRAVDDLTMQDYQAHPYPLHAHPHELCLSVSRHQSALCTDCGVYSTLVSAKGCGGRHIAAVSKTPPSVAQAVQMPAPPPGDGEKGGN
jgi:hypothetical protein